MSNYKHWRNSKEPGATMFITATCLDFAHLFRRPEMRDFMASHLIRCHIEANARLHAFVVMTHHLNPIRSGFCEVPEHYRWSSSRLFALDLYELGKGLRLQDCLSEFSSQ